jgi:hypothetical protein
MPKFIDQPADLGALPKLNDEKTARLKIKVGANKWIGEIRDRIAHVRIGGRRFFTDQALADFLRKNTHKPLEADQPRPPRKRMPPAKRARKPERRPSA